MMSPLQITIQCHSLAIRYLAFGSGLRRVRINFAISGTCWRRWGLMSLAAIVTGSMLLVSEKSEAQTGQDLFSSECSNCHGLSAPAFLKKRVYNAAGNAAIIIAVNAAGMPAPGTPADFNSIATYLDGIKPAITLAPVAFNSPGTVISLPDLSLSTYAIVTGVATVSPPTKGTVTYNFDSLSTVTYTPFTGQSGTDTWTYRGTGASQSTTVRTASVSIAASSAAPLDYSDMWWVGQAENGWGMSIQQHGSVQFIAIYVYDSTGKPTWYVMPGGTWNPNFTTYTGSLYQPTSAPLNNYTPTQFVVGNSPGNLTLNFTSNSTATMQYTINGVSGQKSMQRQVFGTGTSPLTVGDMWWAGTTQDGWGINLVQQGGIVFGVWYTYGPDGKPTWYVLPNGGWNGTTYSGPFYSTTGSGWLGVAYNPNLLAVIPTGTLGFSFSGANNATMNYTFTTGPFAGLTQSKNIVRQPY